MNIALFGTSADPPTKGHSKVLAWLANHYDQVAIWAADNPFKQHQASLDQRNAMLQTLVAELGCHNLKLYPGLSDRRSITTLGRAQAYWPGAHFTLVIGSDLVTQLPSWYQARALLSQVQLLVVPRPGNPLDDQALAPLRDLGATLAIAAMEGLDMSSTAYRDRCINSVVTPAVERYIHQAGLYDCPPPEPPQQSGLAPLAAPAPLPRCPSSLSQSQRP